MIRRGLALFLVFALLARFASAAEEEDLAKKLDAAEKLVASGNHDSALILVDSLLETSPVHPPALLLRAGILEQQEKKAEAIEAYYAALAALEEGEKDRAARKRIDRCETALDKLDKARPIVRDHIEDLEREAKRMKRKDPVARTRILAVVAAMKDALGEPVEAEEENGNDKGKKIRAAVEARALAFYRALYRQDWNGALKVVDPRLVTAVGRDEALKFVKPLGAILKAVVRSEKDIGTSRIHLDADKGTAIFLGKLRAGGKWNEMDDPSYWKRINKRWYLVDKEQIR